MRSAPFSVLTLAGVLGCAAAARGPDPQATAAQASARSAADAQLAPLNDRERAFVPALKRHVEQLAAKVGERNPGRVWELASAADYVAGELETAGYGVDRQGYEVNNGTVAALNLGAELAGGRRGEEVIVIGAHYDSAPGSPGADDNATGTAAVLELARSLRSLKPERTVRFVCFTNQEAPFFQTPQMGSAVYAKRAAERGEKIVAMLSIDGIGYFGDTPSDRRYPEALVTRLPPRGAFLAVVGDTKSERLVASVVQTLSEQGSLPAQGAALPPETNGISGSDHWAFWQMGYPAVLITDGAMFRSPHYHSRSDTPATLDYERMARAVRAIEAVVTNLAGTGPSPQSEPGRAAR
jgi:hypothetical protein